MDIETSLRPVPLRHRTETTAEFNQIPAHVFPEHTTREDDGAVSIACLLYTSDAADDTPCVDLGGRRIIKKKK